MQISLQWDRLEDRETTSRRLAAVFELTTLSTGRRIAGGKSPQIASKNRLDENRSRWRASRREVRSSFGTRRSLAGGFEIQNLDHFAVWPAKSVRETEKKEKSSEIFGPPTQQFETKKHLLNYIAEFR